MITSLSQMAGGLRINLVVASQAANPTVFGKSGSLARANFGSRLVFRLPHDQSYLATGLAEQHTESLGGDGDGLAVVGDRVTRFRAAWPTAADYEALPRTEAEPEQPEAEALAGDAAASMCWVKEELADRLAYAMVVSPSATQIQKQFKGAMNRAGWVRDLLALVRERSTYWEQASAKGEMLS
jgi:hypothetical protein